MTPAHPTRRDFLRTGAAALGAAAVSGRVAWEPEAAAQVPGDRPPARPPGVEVLNPRARVPVGLIIDDSTCLVNLAHFAIPQFAEVFPANYKQPWKNLPREIPDAFVRRFGEWCHGHGVKGKYSIVPHPACVGWVDRELPGWSRAEVAASLDLVRNLMAPDWDVHPEMVSHTWVVDPKTGRPYGPRTSDWMENWGWTDGKSADQIGEYIAYALKPLRNVGLPCEGVTTPGGFGNRALPALAQGSLQALRDVYSAEIPHYFRHLFTDDRSVAPRVEYASGLDGPDPKCVVSVVGCTGDWFGGWDGLTPGKPDQFLTADGKSGRLAEVIARGEPAVMVGHWPGFYFNGEEIGFKILKEIVARLNAHYDNLLWMKLGDLARYWAARELTRVARDGAAVSFHAPFGCPGFTVRVADWGDAPVGFAPAGVTRRLDEVKDRLKLVPGTFTRSGREVVACLDLPKGDSRLVAVGDN